MRRSSDERAHRHAGAVILAAGFLALFAPQARARCPLQRPEDILDCLQSVYADRDSAAYLDLLSEDCRLYYYGPDSTYFDRAQAAQAAGKLFRKAASLRLRFLDGWRLLEGEAPGTWVVDSLTAAVSVRTIMRTSPPDLISRNNRIYLRPRPSPGKADSTQNGQARFVIYRWVHPLEPPTPPGAPQPNPTQWKLPPNPEQTNPTSHGK